MTQLSASGVSDFPLNVHRDVTGALTGRLHASLHYIAHEPTLISHQLETSPAQEDSQVVSYKGWVWCELPSSSYITNSPPHFVHAGRCNNRQELQEPRWQKCHCSQHKTFLCFFLNHCCTRLAGLQGWELTWYDLTQPNTFKLSKGIKFIEFSCRLFASEFSRYKNLF